MIETRALHIWAGLQQAADGEHPYGGDIIEVYAQHLVPDSPCKDPWLEAGKMLYALLDNFRVMNNVCVSVDGREIGDWLNEYRFIHKCDVRVFKNESGKLQRARSRDTVQESSEEYNQCGEPEEQIEGRENNPSEITKYVLPPLFQSKQSEELFKAIENAIIRDKEAEQKNCG